MRLKTLFGFSAVAFAFAFAGCGKPGEGALLTDDSAIGRAKGAIEQQQKVASKDRFEEHLARLRELADMDEAQRLEAEKKHKSYAKGAKDGAAAPLIEFKY